MQRTSPPKSSHGQNPDDHTCITVFDAEESDKIWNAQLDTANGSDVYLDVSSEATLTFAKKDTVEVAGKGKGKVRFVGPDHWTGELKINR